MDIFIGSGNGHKIAATREASQELFPETALNVRGIPVDSGGNEQRLGHENTLNAALHRLAELKKVMETTRSRYDVLLAFQNGIFSLREGDQTHWFDLAWVVAEDAEGNQSFAHSTGIEFDASDVEKARKKGFETTTVGSIIAERTQGDPTDPHFPLTNEVLSRSSILREALKAAIGQLLTKSEPLRRFRDSNS